MKLIKLKITALALAALLALGALAGCTASAGTAADGASTGGANSYSAEDTDAGWSEADATAVIRLNGSSIEVSGSGARADGTTLTISSGGLYLLSGTLEGGQVFVSAPSTDTVRLVLNGVDITAGENAAIYAENCDKLIVTLADGTQNTLADAADYRYADTANEEPDAALFCKDDLTINGGGSLTVNAGFYNGIGTKDDLVIAGGAITVNAAHNGIRGRDSLTVLDGALNITAGNDGLQSNNDSDEAKGWIKLYGGSYAITAGHDGIQAQTTLLVAGGEYDIMSGGGIANAPERAEESWGPGGGMQLPDGMTFPEDGSFPEGMTPPDGMTFPEDGTFPAWGEGGEMIPPDGMAMPEDGTQPTPPGGQSQPTGDASGSTDDASGADGATADDTASTESYKGIKAGGSLEITGGSFVIDSADDALHSNANLTITGGSFAITTGDDGTHADADLLIGGDAAIDITACYEGLEGTNVTIDGGTISIVADDDGINAAGGSTDEGTAGTGRFGPDMFNGGGDYMITINGGVIRITAGYDGLDSNGGITINGGETTISGSLIGGGDGAIDCDGTFAMNGGTLAGAGAVAFAVMGAGGTSLNAEGSQPVLNFQFNTQQAAGTAIELKDAGGAVLVSYTAEKAFNAIALSAPEMQDGQAYTVYASGEEVYTVTLSGLMTSLSETGESVDTGMNVPGGFGGGMGGNQGGRA